MSHLPMIAVSALFAAKGQGSMLHCPSHRGANNAPMF
jgi:hypothetical protein